MHFFKWIVATVALLVFQPAFAEEWLDDFDIIYSTFNEDGGDLYNRDSGWAIYRYHDFLGTRWAAMRFQLPARAIVRGIELGMEADRAKDNVVVDLYRGGAHQPGTILKTVELQNIPPRGPCCQTVTVTFDGVVLQPGGWYWVGIRPHPTHSTRTFWYANSIGLIGKAATNTDGHGWKERNHRPVAGFRILGRFN